MDMQSMSMQGMANEHNTFWRENQVIVTFHSNIPHILADGINNGARILKELNLEAQLHSLNQFLKEKKINYTLSFFEEEVKPQESHPTQESSSSFEQKVFNPPPGVYVFSLSKSIQSNFGEVNSSIVTFFNFRKDTSSSSMSDTASEADARSGIEKGDNDDDDKDRHSRKEPVPVVKIVNQFNTGLGELNNRQVPISAASPDFLCGGAPSNTQGCPLTPPMPVEDDCALWRFNFPKLTPDDLQKMTGEGVTVFILDTLPERKVISSAAEEAGDDNLLLLDVNNSVTFNYNVQTDVIMGSDSKPVQVGKDVYGQHFAMKLPDHGLFIAGIVRDLTPDARVECIRVLDEYCVGDTNMLTQALQYIHDRMSLGGDLYQKPVVINMSLVIPTKEELTSQGMIPDLVYTSLLQQIQSLVGLGAIIAASAGNEGDLRENRSGIRPGALYPAAFANPPDSIDGIIPVGAVDSNGKVTSYSCYPGPRGIATYGGEVPEVTPKDPDPNNPPIVTVTDAVRGIYSSSVYPPLTADDPNEYEAPDDDAWANWVGTSFATPIISAVAARVLELKSKGVPIPNVHDAVIAAAGTVTTTWDKLDPKTTGVNGGSADGPVILAVQQCQLVVEEEEEEEVDIEIVSVVVEEQDQ